jgi:predicted dehydrogenase
VTEGVNVGIVGCGVISKHYAANALAFDAFDIVACADVLPVAAEELAGAHDLTALPVDDLLADPDIDVVLNLTPSSEHAGVTRAALAAGKHVYTEKPLGLEVAEATELLDEANRRGLRIGCAPDIFLGGAYQAARELVDEGAIGRPLAVSAAMLLGGADEWHPSPEQFFQDGAGPLLDMGPYYISAIVALLGPIRRVSGFGSVYRPQRRIMVGPRAGEEFPVGTPTHTSAAMELDGGVTANLVASFDATDRYVCDFFVHGTGGDLWLPDPNAFEGQLRIRRGRSDWEEVPYASRGACEGRGIGLADMAEAIANGGDHRATGQLGLHVVDVARGILQSADEGHAIAIGTNAVRPAALPVASAAR